MEAYFELGYVKRISGLNGILIIAADTDRPENYINESAFFLEENGEAIPYFIESLELDSQGHYRVKFEEVNDAESASHWVGKTVHLPLDRLPELKGKQFYYHEIIGWRVQDQEDSDIGQIIDVFDRGMQELLLVRQQDGSEIYLPLADELLLAVKRSESTMKLEVAQGLLDLGGNQKMDPDEMDRD